jgi:CBS domain-containing protein
VITEPEEHAMQAQDVMHRTVVTIRPHMSVAAATALLVAHGVTSAPVVTAEGVLRGMVSGVDLLRVQSQPAVTAADVMTPKPVTVRPTDDLTAVEAVLLDHGIRAVPVVDRGRLVGIVSRHDVPGCVERAGTSVVATAT